MRKYSDIFYLDGDKLSCTDAVYHEINTEAAIQPINEQLNCLPFKYKKEIEKQRQKLEEEYIIAPSKSPWNGPLLIVLKKSDKDGNIKYRMLKKVHDSKRSGAGAITKIVI